MSTLKIILSKHKTCELNLVIIYWVCKVLVTRVNRVVRADLVVRGFQGDLRTPRLESRGVLVDLGALGLNLLEDP